MDVKNKTFNSLVNYYNKDKNIKKFLALTKAMVTSPKSTPLMRGEICESLLYVILTDFIERNNLKDWRISKGLILKDIREGANKDYLTELDLTLFTPKCIFSFECKSYRGEKFLTDTGSLYVKRGKRYRKVMNVFDQHAKHFNVLQDNLKCAYQPNEDERFKSYRLLYFDFGDIPTEDRREDKYRGMFPICNVNNVYSLFKDFNKRPNYWDMNRVNRVVDIIEKAGEKNAKLHLDYVTNLKRVRSKSK